MIPRDNFKDKKLPQIIKQVIILIKHEQLTECFSFSSVFIVTSTVKWLKVNLHLYDSSVLFGLLLKTVNPLGTTWPGAIYKLNGKNSQCHIQALIKKTAMVYIFLLH